MASESGPEGLMSWPLTRKSHRESRRKRLRLSCPRRIPRSREVTSEASPEDAPPEEADIDQPDIRRRMSVPDEGLAFYTGLLALRRCSEATDVARMILRTTSRR